MSLLGSVINGPTKDDLPIIPGPVSEFKKWTSDAVNDICKGVFHLAIKAMDYGKAIATGLVCSLFNVYWQKEF